MKAQPQMTNHPTRQAMIKAAMSGKITFSAHLAQCPECRQDFALFQAFPLAGSPQLASAPSEWINRAAALAEGKVSRLVRRLVANLSFDSWTASVALGVRGADADKRRLQFSADGIRFDLQATRVTDGWRFSAQLAVPQTDSLADWQLAAGRLTVRADQSGFFTWIAKTPPSKLILRSPAAAIELPSVKWNAPKI